MPHAPGQPRPGASSAAGSKPLTILILTGIALVVAVVVSVLAMVSEDSDDPGSQAGSPVAGPSPEEVVRLYLRAVETKDLAAVKKVTCEADLRGHTSADLHFGEMSLTVAGKHFQVRGRTVVPLTANGKAPAALGGKELHDGDGGVTPLIRDGSSWKVCYEGFYDDLSGSESRSPHTNTDGISWV